jgi:hypothetical protein
VAIHPTQYADTACIVDPNFPGPVSAWPGAGMNLPTGRYGYPAGTFDSGGILLTEFRGQDAGLGPSVIPYATQAMAADQAAQCTSSGTCTVSSVSAPDGTTNAIEIDAVGASGGQTPVSGANFSVATYAGDWILYGAKVRQGANQASVGSCGGGSSFLFADPSSTFADNSAQNYDMQFLSNDGWRSVVVLTQVQAGNSTPHAIQLRLYPGCHAGQGNQFFNWFAIYVPGPNNPAYAGVTLDMVEQWRRELLHGTVPQNFNHPGVAVTLEPLATPALDILNPSTGAIAPFGTANLADWTDGGVANGSVPMWNATTSQWTPGSLPSTANSINGGAVPASAAVLGTNASSQPVAAGTTGSGNVVLATSPTLSGTLAGASETLSGTLSVTGTQTLSGATTMQSNVTLQNGTNANQTLAIQPGSSTEQVGAVQFNNYSGTSEWQVRKDSTNYLRVTDAANSLDRVILPPNANTTINAGAGANAVVVNNTSGSGTAGFIVYEGGSNSSTAAFQVTGSGNTTATGFLQGKFIMGSGTMTIAAGAAAGSSPTIGCATSHVCDGVSGTVALTTGTSPTTGTLATLSFPNTHTNQANCIVATQSATAVITTNTWTESTTAITITANTAPSASTAYTIKYWCGSY